jgi:hypothetical protein
MKNGIIVVACAAMAGASALAANVTVYSNNIGGDAFVNASTSVQGQSVGATGWYYNNVRNTGLAGINSTFARSGNGSASMVTAFGPGGNSSKADIELLSGGVNLGGNFYASSSFGRLGDLTSLSYDWYRDSVSENETGQHAVVRILVDADGDLSTTGDRGGLVFERAYNGGGAVPTDAWVTEDIFAYGGGNGANMWTFGAGMTFAQEGYGVDLSEWMAGAGTIDGDSAVLGFSMGVGSGWAPSLGAVDNFTFGFGGSSTTYNFETAGGQVIPSPLAGVMGAAGLFGVAGVRRRR